MGAQSRNLKEWALAKAGARGSDRVLPSGRRTGTCAIRALLVCVMRKGPVRIMRE